MSEESSTFSGTGSVQTFIAGAFIVALLALGMSIYNFSRTTAAVSALLDLQAAAVTSGDAGAEAHMEAMMTEMKDLGTRVKALEESAAQAAASATEGE